MVGKLSLGDSVRYISMILCFLFIWIHLSLARKLNLKENRVGIGDSSRIIEDAEMHSSDQYLGIQFGMFLDKKLI